MFKLLAQERLSSWAEFRARLEISPTPLEDVSSLWSAAPWTPYNYKVDPFNKKTWPSPWEILVDNIYDDFTKAIMIGYTIKLTKRFAESRISVKTVVDKSRSVNYNLVSIDDEWLLNYKEHGPISAIIAPDYFSIENLVEL